MGDVKSIPQTYRGTRFRSALEANWAATLDSIGINRWSYEEHGVDLDGVWYLPDLYLEDQGVFCEVKGPHDERMYKTELLDSALKVIDPEAEHPEDRRVVLVLRTPEEGFSRWHAVGGPRTSAYVIASCPACMQYAFSDLSGDWSCRCCGQACRPDEWSHIYVPSDWDNRNGLVGTDRLSFVRAPRSNAKAA